MLKFTEQSELGKKKKITVDSELQSIYNMAEN